MNYLKKNSVNIINNTDYIVFFNLFNFFKFNLLNNFLNFFIFIITKIFLKFTKFSNNFIFKKFSLKFLFINIRGVSYYKINNQKFFNNFYFFFKLKIFIINYFYLVKSSIKTVFFLNYITPLSKSYYSIKNFLYSSNSDFSNLTFFKKSNDESLVNFHVINNVNSTSNISLLKQQHFVNDSTVIDILDNNLIFSFFYLWKILLYMPIQVTNITEISNFYNLFFKNKFIKNNVLLNYLNISNLNFLKLNTKKYSIKKKIQLKVFKFIEDLHFSDTLVRLVESVSNMKTLILINRSLLQQLSFYEWTRFDLFRRRFQSSSRFKFLKTNTRFLQAPFYFFYNMGKSQDFYWFELTLVCFLFYKTKDTTILMTFLYNKMRVMSLFKHRFFLRRVFFILRVLFYEISNIYGVVGIRLRIVGKISVTGNSRTRTIHFKEGIISNSNMTTRVDHNYTIIKTNTGCLGLSLWLFF